jgi:hypothetical protein
MERDPKMSIENADRRDANRILSTALEDPRAISDQDLEDALGLLGSDAKRVRVGAAWIFAIVAADTPDRILSYLPQIAALLDDPETEADAKRALAYVTQANPIEIESELREMDEETARLCRKALWGQFASRRVIETPDRDEDNEGTAMGRNESDEWGWMGGGSGSTVYDTGSELNRKQPPTERPVDPPTVDYEYDRYTPAETIYRGETVESFKVVYHTDDDQAAPGLFKQFTPPEEVDFESAFDRRIRMWHSVDDHEAILPIVDWGLDPNPWVVTAYEDTTGVGNLEGEDRLAAAVWTLRTVARSLCFAHGRGVIHGGLTPGSVVQSSIISEPHAWRFPRVTDWGYVSLLREGTPPDSVPDRYLAPEHIDPESYGGVDGITDVYGFGLIAYETLVGRAPFSSNVEGITANEELSLPTTLDRRLPDIESFLRRCLANRKPERFETVEAMMTAFRSATEGIDV